MTAKEMLINKGHVHYFTKGELMFSIEQCLDFAKEITELSFEAGYNRCAWEETNHPEDTSRKEDFIKQLFPE